jgi:AcrR family transcriptional regulator
MQRERILDAALSLMAEHGAGGTSMRAVAAATGCNVATLYHYFPSKRELLQAAFEHRLSADLFGHPFPEGLPGTPAERLGALLDFLFVGVTADAALWRALLAEAIHGDDDVLQPLLELSSAFEDALSMWIRELLPDVPALHDPSVVRVLRHAIYGVMVEHLPQEDRRRTMFAERARELGAVFTALESR